MATMLYHDVIDKLIDASGLDEGIKTAMHTAVVDRHAEAIDALSDEQKELRRAPVDILAGSVPAIFVGGITQDQLDRIVAQAIANYEAKKTAPAAAADVAPAAVAPVTPAAAAESVPSADDLAAFKAWQAEQAAKAAPPSTA